jgi:outer membrane protein
MQKISIIIFVFFFNLINANANESVFFLDIDYVVNNSNSGKVIIKKLQELNSKNNKILNQEEEEIRSLEAEITKQKNIISKDDLNKKIENLKKKVNSYRLNKKQMSNEFDNFKNNELEIYFKKITPIIEEFMNIKSIKIILDKKNIFIANANYDITDELIEFLNNKIK